MVYFNEQMKENAPAMLPTSQGVTLERLLPMLDHSNPNPIDETIEFVVMTRREAIALGSTTYFTGKPCVNGHVDLRFVSGYACRECARLKSQAAYHSDPKRHSERAKAYQDKNRDRIRDSQRQYRESNRDLLRAKSKARYARDREEISAKRARSHRLMTTEQRLQKRARARAWRERNREHVRDLGRKWFRENPDRAHVFKINAKARARGAEGTISLNEWVGLVDKYGRKCLACGESDVTITADHIVPISRGGQNTIDNIQPLCVRCNNVKRQRVIDYRERAS